MWVMPQALRTVSQCTVSSKSVSCDCNKIAIINNTFKLGTRFYTYQKDIRMFRNILSSDTG